MNERESGIEIEKIFTIWRAEIRNLKKLKLLEDFPMDKPISSAKYTKNNEKIMANSLDKKCRTKVKRERWLIPLCNEVGINVLPDNYNKLDDEKKNVWIKKYVKARDNYAKNSYGDVKKFIVPIRSKENAYIYNMTVLLMQHVSGPIHGYSEWILGERHHSLSYVNEASVKKYIMLTKKDLKAGHIDDAIKHTLSFLLWCKYSPYYREHNPLLLTRESFIEPNIEMNKGHEFGAIRYRQLSAVFAELILAISDDKYTEYFYHMDSNAFPSEVMIQMIHAKLDAKDIAGARRYLDGLNSKDKFNPSIQQLENEYSRLLKRVYTETCGSILTDK